MVITSNTLVTVDEAAKELDLNSHKLHVWLSRGHIKRRGYQKPPMGRPCTLVDLEEVRHFLKIRCKTDP